ncbi:MAG: YecA family protein, partial [bacterium]
HTFLDELALFFDRQLVFEVTNRWPGPSWAHGLPGYWSFSVELLGSEALVDAFLASTSTGRNDPCPCRGPRKFKRCHLSQFETLAQKIGLVRTRLRDWRMRQSAEVLSESSPAA